jgi:hypothetical protein
VTSRCGKYRIKVNDVSLIFEVDCGILVGVEGVSGSISDDVRVYVFPSFFVAWYQPEAEVQGSVPGRMAQSSAC